MEQSSYERRDGDFIAEELASTLRDRDGLDFDTVFSIVLANLRAGKRARESEAVLRLRIHGTLQFLVKTGCVEKRNERYHLLTPALSEQTSQRAAEHCRDLLKAVRRTPFERAR